MQLILREKLAVPCHSRAGRDPAGRLTVIRNAISIDELALLFFVYALFDDVVAVTGAARAGEAHSRWTTLMIEKLTGIGAAVAVITLQATGADLPLDSLIAAWALATGVLEIAAALPRANTAGIASRVGAYRICVWNSADRTWIPPPIRVEKSEAKAAG